MLAEFVKELVGLGQKAKQVEFHTHDKLPRLVFARYGDSLNVHDVPPTERDHALLGFDDLVAAIGDTSIAKAPEVYVGADYVVALLDRADRRERVYVKLEQSKRFAQCVKLEATPAKLQPRDAVKMLRFELHGGNVDHVVQALSRIDFVRSSAGKTDVAHGRESLGRSDAAAVQQADNVPKDFALAVPVWSTHGFSRYTVQVEFGIYLDLEAQVVELRVLPDEIKRVQGLAMASAAADLRAAFGAGVPVFLGVP